MRRLKALQYKILQKFCRDLFQKQKYISQRQLHLLISQNLNPCVTRYRRLLIDIMFLTERNKMMYPGPMLYHFRKQDFVAINKLMQRGRVLIINNEIHFFPAKVDGDIDFPKHWEVIKIWSENRVIKYTIHVQNNLSL